MKLRKKEIFIYIILFLICWIINIPEYKVKLKLIIYRLYI